MTQSDIVALTVQMTADRNLIIVHTEGFQDVADFLECACHEAGNAPSVTGQFASEKEAANWILAHPRLTVPANETHDNVTCADATCTALISN
jgi:hypothetical protein